MGDRVWERGFVNISDGYFSVGTMFWIVCKVFVSVILAIRSISTPYNHRLVNSRADFWRFFV